MRNHQEQNARAFEKVGGAEVITEDILTSDLLYQKITEVANNKEVLESMSENVKKLAKVDALEEIYNLVKKMRR